MSEWVGNVAKESSLVAKCLEGDDAALSLFRSEYIDPLAPVLLSRGATASQVDDLIGTLWSDCIAGRAGSAPLLARYQDSRSQLQTWIRRIALNRLVDQARQSRWVTYYPAGPAVEPPGDHLADQPILAAPSREEALTGLLRESLRTAFESCPAEDLLKLRLVYLEELTREEVARMWGCHRVTIQRDLRRAMQLIAERTLREIGRVDPNLKLTWNDFKELCATEDPGFL